MEIKVLASGSSGNCYFISDGKSSLLLDAGIPIKQIRIGTDFRLSSVAGALITHRHGDHAKAVPALLSAGIKVYAPGDVFLAAGTQEAHNATCIIDGTSYRIGTFTVKPFHVNHDVPNFGYYIHSTVTRENLVYFTDTYYVNFTFPEIHYLLAECNYDPEALDKRVSDGSVAPEFKRRLVKSHMSINTLIDLLKANDLTHVKQIYLLHLSDNNSREDEFLRRVRALTGCEVYIC